MSELRADDVIHDWNLASGAGPQAPEVLLVDDELSSMVAARAPSADLARVAVRSGMLTLRQAGMAHVRRGATSVEELLRVVS